MKTGIAVKTATTGLLLLAVTGCGTMVARGPFARADAIKETPSDHPHRYPNAKVAGDYHVVNFMNQRAGKIGIQILDRYEEVDYLYEPDIKAEITHNGKTQTVWLQGEGYKEGNTENPARGASIFSARLDWVKNAHEARLKVWVPIRGDVYELTFECKAAHNLPKHSGPLE